MHLCGQLLLYRRERGREREVERILQELGWYCFGGLGRRVVEFEGFGWFWLSFGVWDLVGINVEVERKRKRIIMWVDEIGV